MLLPHLHQRQCGFAQVLPQSSLHFAAAVAQCVQDVHGLVFGQFCGAARQFLGKLLGGLGALFGGKPSVGGDLGEIVGAQELRQPLGVRQRAQGGIVFQHGAQFGGGAAFGQGCRLLGAGHDDDG